MPTTPLNGWTYPSSAEFVANGATAMGVIANAIDTSAQLMYTRICTSATRPAGNIAGRVIAETDTDRVLYNDGAGWIILAEPANAWTPTLANLTVGSGVWTASYHRSDGWCDFRGHFAFAGAANVTGALALTLPIAGISQAALGLAMVCNFNLILNSYPAICVPGSGTSITLNASNSAGTYTIQTATTAAIPFTWNFGGASLNFSGRYQMVTKYS